MLGNRARWGLVVVVAVVALTVALWPRNRQDAAPNAGPAPEHALTQAQRDAAGLAPCPAATATATAGPLRTLTLSCLADGKPVRLADALAGKPALVNLWAYWCQPCATELPALAAYARRVGTAVTVFTVHSDPDQALALARLADLGVRLFGAQDGDGRVRAAVGAPAALPVSVLLRPDGSVASLVVRPFRDENDIAATIAAELGVSP